VVLPTDTVYGLAAALAKPQGVARLAVLKGRPRGVPIAVLVADVDQACEVGVLGGAAAGLAADHWPGPLTIVVEARGDVGSVVGSEDGSIGIRCPDHELVRRLARAVGPLATTSANRHGRPTPETAEGVVAELPDVDAVIDLGPCSGTPSTVVDARFDPLTVLRQGALVLESEATGGHEK
jgi:tRNA threonylcarbamoyl adenosine modification protein (Sua5/YciO/YrdC/YwlC family)